MSVGNNTFTKFLCGHPCNISILQGSHDLNLEAWAMFFPYSPAPVVQGKPSLWIHPGSTPESTHLPPQFLWKLLWSSLPLTIFEQWQGVVVWTSKDHPATHKSKISRVLTITSLFWHPRKFNEWIPMWMMALENVSSFQHVAILGIYVKFGGGVYSYNWGETRKTSQVETQICSLFFLPGGPSWRTAWWFWTSNFL